MRKLSDPSVKANRESTRKTKAVFPVDAPPRATIDAPQRPLIDGLPRGTIDASPRPTIDATPRGTITTQKAPLVPPPSSIYFGVTIRDHPDDPVVEIVEKRAPEDDDDLLSLLEDDDEEREDTRYTEPTQVLFQDGRVKALLVDKEFIEEINRNAKESDYLCQCCMDEEYEVSPALQEAKAQSRYIFKVLMIENVIHLAPMLGSGAQYFVKEVHDFVYEQWVIILLMIIVLCVTMMWAIAFSDLARHYPADNVLLFMKFFFYCLLGMMVNGVTERCVLMWVLQFEDVPDPGALVNVYLAKANPEWNYTYPFVVPIHVIELTIVYSIVAFYFKAFKGNIQQDKMLWLAMGCQVSMSAVLLLIFISGALNMRFFYGPSIWDKAQIFVTSFGTCSWGLWRLYCLRQVLAGKKYDVNERCFKKTALDFVVLT